MHKENFEAELNKVLIEVNQAFGEDTLDIHQTKKIQTCIENIGKDERAGENLKQIIGDLEAHNNPEQKKLAGSLEQFLNAFQALMDFAVSFIAATFEYLFNAKKEERGYFVNKLEEAKEEVYIGPFSRA